MMRRRMKNTRRWEISAARKLARRRKPMVVGGYRAPAAQDADPPPRRDPRWVRSARAR